MGEDVVPCGVGGGDGAVGYREAHCAIAYMVSRW